ncbi:MAG: luciferase family protein [Rhodococcus sp. (in: high G+C Gram-positive bacteria)]|uniref:luciferase domain-containing protein n=1 Tax=unclassified Rhodococcus (in: high G+C Gram-positive bacteria) TaxID=192944 RepID=UPI000A91D420|nr:MULTISPECIES: luciferase family protein [unclassified Rhodococcus (in: high G+C Gram-positive bacteria)]RMB76660.1 hypothetical protein AYK61_09120 [Rhodococcus sp. SBT000017]
MRIAEDYAAWKALGPGGLPANVVGWAITKILTPLGRDPLTVRDAVADAASPTWELPARPGPRPSVAPYPIPHRQLNGIAPGGPVSVFDVLESHARTDSDRLYLGTSHFEKRGQALYVVAENRRPGVVTRAGGEIAHVHPSDGSLHVVAQHGDAQRIIDAGWGELHPLAGRPPIGLPEPYVLLYSPRDRYDVEQITRILDRVVETALRTG